MKREDINYLAQKIPIEVFEEFHKKICEKFEITILSQPVEQTLMVPIKDPVSGGDFYSGEVLVSSCIVEINKVKGWSMVMDRNLDLSFFVAVFDACYEASIYKEEITALMENARIKYEEELSKTNQFVNSTKVSFDLM